MDSESAEVIDQAGYKCMTQGKYREAIDYFTKAIEKDPTNGVYYTDRCAAYLGVYEIDKAMEDGIKGVELSPNEANCNMQLGILYDYKKDYAKALQYHQKALEIQPNNDMMWGFVKHDKARLDREHKATGAEFLEFLDSKGGECAFLTRSAALYHFLDDISENMMHIINYVGDPMMDLFSEFMMQGQIPPELGNTRVPVAKVRKEWDDAMAEREREEGDKN